MKYTKESIVEGLAFYLIPPSFSPYKVASVKGNICALWELEEDLVTVRGDREDYAWRKEDIIERLNNGAFLAIRLPIQDNYKIY